MIKVAWKDVFHSRNFSLILISIAFSIFIPIVMLSVSTSFMYAAETESERVFGSFDNVLYLANEFPEIEMLDDYGSLIGTIDIYHSEFDSENRILGYMSEDAIKLANLDLLSGTWPKTENEVVICNSLVYKIKPGLDVGDVVSVAGHNYIISGIVNDYYSVWNKPDDCSGILFPNIIITKNDSENVVKTLQQHLLIKNSLPFPSEMYRNNMTLIANTNRIENDMSGKYRVPSFAILLTTCCSTMLNIYIFEYYVENEKKKLAIFRCMGLTKKESIKYYVLKIVIYLVLSIPCGLIMGYVASIAIISLFGALLHSNYVFVFSGKYIVFSILICLMAVGISLFVASHKLRKLSPVEQLTGCNLSSSSSKSCGKKKESLKCGITRLSCIEIKTHFKKSIIILLMISFSISLFITTSLYLNIYSSRTKDVPGRMPLTFDYEFLSNPYSSNTSYVDTNGELVNINNTPTENSVAFILPHGSVFPPELLTELKENTQIDMVKSYLEVNDLYMLNSPDEQNNPYLSGYPLDKPIPEAIRLFYGIQNETRKIQYCGYSEEELLQMDPYVIAGDIDIDKIRSGEEVILVVPMYELEFLEGGYTRQKFLTSDSFTGESNQFKDDFFSVGDEIEFLQFVPTNVNITGYINQDQMEEYLECKQYSVRIGAIICNRIGWFDVMSQMPTAYTLMGLNDSISNLGLSPTTDRVQVFLKNTTSYLDFEPIIQYYHSKVEGFNFKNNAAEMTNFKKFQTIISVLFGTLTAVTALIVVAIIFIEEWIAFHQNKRYYALLRINGLTNGGLLKLLLIRSCIIAITGIIGSVIMSSVVMRLLFGTFSEFVDYMKIEEILLPILFSFIMLIGIPFFTIKKMSKKTLPELIEED